MIKFRSLMRYLLIAILVYHILLLIYFFKSTPQETGLQQTHSTFQAKISTEPLNKLQQIAKNAVPMSWLPDLYGKDAVAFLNKDLNRNRKTFEKCLADFSLSVNKVLKIKKLVVLENDFIKLQKTHANLNRKNAMAPEVYVVKINFESIIFRHRLKSPQELNCYIQRFGKRLDASEGLINYDKPIYFQMRLNFTVMTEKYGYHSFICYRAAKKVYSNVFAILPTDMSRLVSSFEKYSLKVDPSLQADQRNSLISGTSFKECKFPNLKNTANKMNTLIINLESVSYNHFQRIFPITFKYLKEELANMIVYDNFNRVGDDSLSNILPLLTGLIAYENTELGIGNELEKYFNDTDFHDDLPLIWREFAKLGYVTMFNEESPRNGFLNQPTTFYTSPYFERYERMARRDKLCFENEPIFNRTLNLITAFISRMSTEPNKNLPYFSVNFLKYYTSNMTTVPVEFDQCLKDTIMRFESNQLLDNTLLIIMSDKGSQLSKYSYRSEAGKQERNLPFFSMRLPKKLRGTKYQMNAEYNQRNIFSAFDVYKTLQHFKQLNSLERLPTNCNKAFAKSLPQFRIKRGVSLFEKMPVDRACTSAMIPMVFCSKLSRISYTPNNYSHFKDETGYNVKQVSQIVVDKINNGSNDYRDQCIVYMLKKTASIKLLFSTGFSFYEVQVLVSPGNVLFEGYLKMNKINRLEVYGEISRMSPYQSESFCIEKDYPKLRGFCSCKVN